MGSAIPGPTDYFETIADFLDTAYPEDTFEPTFFKQAVGSRIGTALDLGIGTGRIALPLARSGWAVTGVDRSARALELVRRKLRNEPRIAMRLIHGDALALDAITETFDVIVACGLFFHMPDAESYLSLLQTAARLLVDGGAFVFDVECRSTGGWKADGVERYMGSIPTANGWLALRQASILSPARRQQLGLFTFEESDDGGNICRRHVYHVVASYITLADLTPLVETACLELEQTWGSYDGSPYVEGQSAELIVRARKRSGTRGRQLVEDCSIGR